MCNILKSQNSTHITGVLNRAHIVEAPQFPFLTANIQTNRNSIVLSWIGKVHKLKCKELNVKSLLDFIFFNMKARTYPILT